MKEKIKPPLLVLPNTKFTNWDSWLAKTEKELIKIGYKKYDQRHKGETFAYWKTFKKGKKSIYQVGILFYDFRRYAYKNPSANKISIMYQAMIISKEYCRIDMDVMKDINLKEFEVMAKDFYESMSKYC